MIASLSLSFSADPTFDFPHPVQETNNNNVNLLIAPQLDESKNDRSATCLTNHDRKTFIDKSTQTPVPSDECLTPLEYEYTTGNAHQCTEGSSSSMRSQNFVGLSQKITFPWEMDSAFLVYGCGTGQKPNMLTVAVAYYTVDDRANLPTVLHVQGEDEHDKSANCLANERSNPRGPLDQYNQIHVPPDECLSLFEYESTTGKAHQCTEEFPPMTEHCMVAIFQKITLPQEMEPAALLVCSGCGFWPKPVLIDKQSTVALDYETGEHNESTLLLPTLRPFLSTIGRSEEMEQDI